METLPLIDAAAAIVTLGVFAGVAEAAAARDASSLQASGFRLQDHAIALATASFIFSSPIFAHSSAGMAQ